MAQSVYKITTDQGEYNITVDDAGGEDTPQGAAKPTNPGGGLSLEAIRGGFGPATNLVERFGTSPTAAKTASSIANKGVTLAGVIKGAMDGNATEVLASPTAGWAAGKGAYWLTQGAQSAARPVATGMDAAKPFVKGAIHTLAGVQGLLDLAQMAEPNRKDIGFLGIAGSQKADPAKAAENTDAYLKSHGYTEAQIADLRQRAKTGPTLNSLAAAFEQSIKNAPDVWAHVLESVKQRMSGK